MRFALFTMVLIATSFGIQPNATAQNNSLTVKYKGTSADFANPERGFYRYTHTKASAPSPLELEQLKVWRNGSKAESGNYRVYSTLVFRYYEMDIFKNQPVSAAFLESLTQDFTIARQAGIKLLPRFTYTLKQTAGKCPEGFICPPYGDAPKEMVLQHIAQLKDVLHANADVIAAVQMGFIGVWGEQYYTDFFGDASQNTSTQKLTDSNWQDRLDVLRAVLNAVPKDRMVQVRYPQIKQRLAYGINAPVTSAALTEMEAFSESDKARIGFHNDCFLASANDYGTYEDYGNSSTPRADANEPVRAYKRADSRFVVVGGETCTDDFSPQNDCEPAGRAQAEMREMHYSYLNCAYNNKVNNDWQTGGCMENIKKQLGYRFLLKSAKFPNSSAPGGSFSLTLELENEGYASPFNKRPLVLVLRNKTDKREYKINLDSDVRKWFSGSVKVNAEVKLPTDIIAGKYDLLLSLPDQHGSISDRPEYAIRLANAQVWEPATGYNNLNYALDIR